MTHLTSEKIAKSLKGAGLNSKERIDLALEAWNNNNIFFPNKDDFLFEWICSVLAKPNTKNLKDCTLFQTRYWQLLNTLLKYYSQPIANNNDLKQISMPIIRISLITPVTTLLQHLYTTYKNDIDFRAVLINDVTQCIQLLFSKSFQQNYRPTLEQMTTAIELLLSSLKIQLELVDKDNNSQEGEEKNLDNLLNMAYVLLNRYDEQLIQTGNQRKLFVSFVGKLLNPILCVRYKLKMKGTDRCIMIADQLSTMLCNVIYHPDSISEYNAVLKNFDSNILTNSNKNASYVTKIFEELNNIISTAKTLETVNDVYDILPILLSEFIKQYRYKHNITSASIQDINRSVEFGFFMNIRTILDKGRDLSFNSYMETRSLLLEQVLILNIYNARNDTISQQQYTFLNSLANETVDYLLNKTKENQGFIFDNIKYLLEIDIGLIEAHMKSIWPFLIQSTGEADKANLLLDQAILKSYAASRQIDVFIDEILDTITNISIDNVYELLQNSLFSKRFLNEFSNTITKNVPTPQIPVIFEKFINVLLKVNKLDSQNDLHKPKKSKKSHTTATSINKLATLLITPYLVEFINSLRLGHQQRQQFKATTLKLYEDYLLPSFNKESDIQSNILPALQIHFALTNAFYDAYWIHIPVESREWIISQLKSLFLIERYKESLSSKLFLVYSANVIFQHIYFTSLASNSELSSKENTELVEMILDVIVDKSDNQWINSSWDGNMIHLHDMSSVKIALWKLLTDEWFDTTCQVIQDSDKSYEFATLVLTSYYGQNDNISDINIITVKSLNSTLIQSANFYESKCMHKHSIGILVKELIQLFDNMMVPAEDQTADLIATHIKEINNQQTLTSKSENLVTLGNQLISSLSTGKKNAVDIERSDQTSVTKINYLLRLLLLFPLECYNKQERNQILRLLLLIDAWLLTSANADLENILYGSLQCRVLYLRFMKYIGNAGILATEPSFLHWMIHGLEGKIIDNNNLKMINIKNNWIQVTKNIDYFVLSSVLSLFGGMNPNEKSINFIHDVLQRRFGLLDVEQKISHSFEWTLSFMSVLADYLPTYIKRKNNVENKHIENIVKEISKVSQYIKVKLQQGNSLIESSAIDKADITISYAEFTMLFEGVRLTQQCIQLLVNDQQGMDELSQIIQSIEVPFLLYLKSEVSTITDVKITSLFKMTTSFIGGICSALSVQADNTDNIEIILKAIYSVLDLSLAKNQTPSIKELELIVENWIRNLSKPQHFALVEYIMDQADYLIIPSKNDDDVRGHYIFISLTYVLLIKSSDEQKRHLRNTLSTFILKISTIVGKTTQVDILKQTLNFLIKLTSINAYTLSVYDVSIIYTCILQILHPSTRDTLQSNMNKSTAQSIFDMVCQVISNLSLHHRDSVSEVMGPLISILQSLLHCFKSTQISLVSHTKANNNNSNKKRKSMASVNSSSSSSTPSSSITSPTSCILASYAPLDNSSAEKYARICNQLTIKSNGTKRSDITYQNITRHIPYLLLAYFLIQSDISMNITAPSLKATLSFGWYDLLSACTPNDRDMIMVGLNPTGQALFKTFYNTWRTEHKYTGQ
ncbi:unnamed protein product [Cunninghamella blakesleeana]